MQCICVNTSQDIQRHILIISAGKGLYTAYEYIRNWWQMNVYKCWKVEKSNLGFYVTRDMTTLQATTDPLNTAYNVLLNTE